MPATFDKEAYKAIRAEVRRNMAAVRLQHFLIMSCMKALMSCLQLYRGTYFWHEGDRQHMRELSAKMAADLAKMIRIVNTTRSAVNSYIEGSEEKRRAELNY